MERNQWNHVTNSSLISGYKYDGENITVEFKSNKSMYIYYNVPDEIIEKIGKDNAGKIIYEHIIEGEYKYKRLD